MPTIRTMNKRRLRARDRALFRRRHARKIIDFARLYGTWRWASTFKVHGSELVSKEEVIRRNAKNGQSPLVATDFSAIERRVLAKETMT